MTTFKNLNIVKDPAKVKVFLNTHADAIFGQKAEIQWVSISVLQAYRDNRSYNITLRYDISAKTTDQKTLLKSLAATSSWPVSNKYGYQVGNFIFNNLRRKTAEVKIPRYCGYIAKYNLVLRDYLLGAQLLKIITRSRSISMPHIKSLMKWLANFQKIKPTTAIKKSINLNNLESNLKILKKRKAPEIELLDKEYAKIREQIINWSKKYNKTLVHGDFNPANILVDKNTLAVIDFEGVHRGDRLMDVANLCSYLSILLNKSGADNRKISTIEKGLISSYEKATKKQLNVKEAERFLVYKKYFTLVFRAYELVWG